MLVLRRRSPRPPESPAPRAASPSLVLSFLFGNAVRGDARSVVAPLCAGGRASSPASRLNSGVRYYFVKILVDKWRRRAVRADAAAPFFSLAK